MNKKYRRLMYAGGLCSLLVLLSAGPAFPKIFTVGMVNSVNVHNSAMEGFKAGMAELGYAEGKDILYLYNGPVESTPEAIDAEIKRLLARGVDLLVTAGSLVDRRAKLAVEGTDRPVLFTAALRPIIDNLVESLGHPGGNMTGVRVVDTSLKTVEWLLKVSPGIKKIFIPYNPDDPVSTRTLEGLDEKAAQFGVQLVFMKLHSVEDAGAAIRNLPEDIDAILRVPSPTFDMRNSELSQAAIDRGLPMAASVPLDDAVLLMCSTDLFDAGKQNARLAHQIRLGEKPGELPVETAEPALRINLKTAEKIGIFIPDEILVQAKVIIR